VDAVKPTLAAARTHGAQSRRQWLSGARTPQALGKPIPTPDDQRGAFNSDASKDLQGWRSRPSTPATRFA